jgi:hypothetical protein
MTMKHSVKIVGAGIFILVSFLYVYPQGWRGIVPLKSTRADVVKILGKPSRFGYVYDFDKGAIRIMYSRKRCEQGLPSDWGNWNVPLDTVINISVDDDTPVEDLKISNLEKYKWYTDDSGTTYYHLKDKGIEYSVRDGRVTQITYGPTSKDQNLLCKKNTPEIRY